MAKRPNILVFSSDNQQGQTVLPHHPCHTPHVQKLAAEGVMFTHSYTVAPHCCPSRASLATGLFPSRHGVFNNVSNGTALRRGLNPSVTTYAQALKASGYRMVISGKWHVSTLEGPVDRGWEQLYGQTGAVQIPYEHEKWSKVDLPIDMGQPRGRGEIVRRGYHRYTQYGSYPDKGPKGYEGTIDYFRVQKAIEKLPELAAGADPWFLFIGIMGPHEPFMIPEKYARMYNPADVPLPPNYHDDLQDKPRIYQRLRRERWSQLTEEEVREAIAHYWGYCTMVDDMFGDVLEALDRTGVADNTVVLYLSDHGDYCGAHGLFCKGAPAFDETYHVPTVIRWPLGLAQPGRMIDEFVSMVDFAPTFLELAGCPVPADLSGRSLVPFLRGETPADWPDAYYTQFNGTELYFTQRAVRTKNYKYVFNGFDFDELYDLRKDPHELHNLSEDPAYDRIKQELIAKLWDKARKEKDYIFNEYMMASLFPYGPYWQRVNSAYK